MDFHKFYFENREWVRAADKLLPAPLPLPLSLPTLYPSYLSLPYLTFPLHPALFARFLVPYWLLTGTAQGLSAHSLGSCIKALLVITIRVNVFL